MASRSSSGTCVGGSLPQPWELACCCEPAVLQVLLETHSSAFQLSSLVFALVSRLYLWCVKTLRSSGFLSFCFG